ncbi:hypothetical protein BDA99DRAFT_539102 [Phascolomyces articulosus]|uniref:Uncharacterized protein n=1 Tax=Phascolomyces articulosus TaxID=60185 RepID=A0AAD5PDZ7_9FUNG|nr:hypothetical protein BDA99DRAFT_539102 [Phascolomyces articulosus]
MAPTSEPISTIPDDDGDIQPMQMDEQQQRQTIIAQPVPRTKPILVPSPSWPRHQSQKRGGDNEHSPSSFELLQRHVNQIAQQSNEREGNGISSLANRLSYSTYSSDEEDQEEDEEDEKKVRCRSTPKPEDPRLKSILVHHEQQRRGSSTVSPDHISRGTPFFDATDATMVVQPPPRPQTVHFSNKPPQVFRYPPSQHHHYVEQTNHQLLLPWPEEENEEYLKKQKEKERLIQEKMKRVNEKWK